MNDAGQQTLSDAANALQWALGEMEMQMERLIQLGDPSHLVKSESQRKGMAWATNIMLKCKSHIENERAE